MESGISALLIMGSPLILLYVWLCFKTRSEKDTEGEAANEYTKSAPYIYKRTGANNCIIDKERKSRLRKRPPNASFFGRLDGKEISIEGPYEEKFLNRIEAMKWKLKQERKELKSMED